MGNALKNVRPTHLLDRELLEAWSARPADVPAEAAGAAKTAAPSSAAAVHRQ
jgi:hypothetical protein